MTDESSPPARRAAHPPSPRRPPRATAPSPAPAPRDWNKAMPTAAVFAVAFVIGALLYWPALDMKKNLPDALYGMPIVLAALTALVDSWFSRRPFGQSLWVGGALLPAVVFARVMFDVMQDPTSHNLWPFEIAIAIGVGLPAAVVGAALGWLLLRATGRTARR
jgi:hypothetical protein